MSSGSRLSNLSERELKRAYWLVTHKHAIRRGFIAFLSILAAILITYSTYTFIDWLFISGVQEQAVVAGFANNNPNFSALRSIGAPKQLSIGNTNRIIRGGSVDLVALVTNENAKWLAEFSYRFAGTGINTAYKKGFVLPGDSLPFYVLGVTGENISGTPDLEITNLVWKRVNPHIVKPNYPTWSADRLNLSILNSVFTPPVVNSSIPASIVSFAVKNDSAFSFSSVTFFVTVWSGNSVAGIGEVAASNFLAGQTRNLEISLLETVTNVTKIDVKPIVNILDERVFLSPGL